MTVRMVAVLAASAFVLSSSSAGAQSHLGQPVANHVTLVYGPVENELRIACGPDAKNDWDFYRVMADATREAQPFYVPESQRLVVTDVSWSARAASLNGTLSLPQMGFHIMLVNGEGSSNMVFQSEPTEPPGSAPLHGRTEHLTAGFVAAPLTRMCPVTYFGTKGLLSKTPYQLDIVVHGYLVDAAGR